MFLIAFSAAFVGFLHSLAPGHWLPVVLMTKARRWNGREAIFAALVAASGHVIVSVGLGAAALYLNHRLLQENLHDLEGYAGWILVVFGILYAVYSHLRHRECHGHEHHGPDPQKSEKAPYFFLFSLGLSPCFAVLPVFVAALALGDGPLLLAMGTFAIGVVAAFVGATFLVSRGLVKLDHPIFEHHGDTLVGAGVAVMGVILLFLPHQH